MSFFTKNLIESHQKSHFTSPDAFLQMRVWFSTGHLILIFYDISIAKNTLDIKIEAKSMKNTLWKSIQEASFLFFFIQNFHLPLQTSSVETANLQRCNSFYAHCHSIFRCDVRSFWRHVTLVKEFQFVRIDLNVQIGLLFIDYQWFRDSPLYPVVVIPT